MDNVPRVDFFLRVVDYRKRLSTAISKNSDTQFNTVTIANAKITQGA